MRSAESDIGYLEVNAVLNREPMELSEKSIRTVLERTSHNSFCAFCSLEMFFLVVPYKTRVT